MYKLNPELQMFGLIFLENLNIFWVSLGKDRVLQNFKVDNYLPEIPPKGPPILARGTKQG